MAYIFLEQLLTANKCVYYSKRGSGFFMASSKRKSSIDILRGIAVAIMVIVDNPGNSERIYLQLRHPKWNGLTLADFAFPVFILTMCMAVPIVVERKIASERMLNIVLSIIKRSFILVLLGILLNGFPLFNFATIRIPGVLQRLGVVYLIVSLFYLVLRCNLKKKAFIITSMLIAAFAITIGYYFLLRPFGFSMESNLVSRVDVHLLRGHIYTESFDPEGILSTIGAVATGILGCFIGYIIILDAKHDVLKPLYIGIFGVICTIFAFQFNKIFPFNKQLWSSSFILIVAGYASLGLTLLYSICDIYKKDKIFIPFIALGSNPILVYISTEIIRKSLWKINVFDYRLQTSFNLPTWITMNFITPWAGNRLDSLYFSLIYIIIWIVITKRMHSKNIFIKI